MNCKSETSPAIAIEILSYLPARPDYETWIKAVSAIANSYDEATALNILLTRFTDEKPNEHADKIKNRLHDVNFGTLVYLAEQNGYRPACKTAINAPKLKHCCNSIKSPLPPKKAAYNLKEAEPELIHRYLNSETEIRAKYLVINNGLTRIEAERFVDGKEFQICTEKTTDKAKERLYRIAINSKIINKNINPVTNQPYKDYYQLTHGFENKELTLDEIIEAISKGHAFICGHLKQEPDGTTHRKKENWICSDLIAIDIDNSINKRRLTDEEGYLSIEDAFSIPAFRYSILLYTTPSHTEDWHRYRILFPLPLLCKDKEQYSNFTKYFANLFNADLQAGEPARAFYGSNTGRIFNTVTGELMREVS